MTRPSCSLPAPLKHRASTCVFSSVWYRKLQERCIDGEFTFPGAAERVIPPVVAARPPLRTRAARTCARGIVRAESPNCPSSQVRTERASVASIPDATHAAA